MNQTSNERILEKDFASPKYCRNLALAGLDARLPFFWKIYGNSCFLNSYAFDKDGIYENRAATVDSLVPPTITLPAFSISDLDKVLPDYSVSRQNNNYIVRIKSTETKELAIVGPTLADAMAITATILLHTKKICLENAIDILNIKAT